MCAVVLTALAAAAALLPVAPARAPAQAVSDPVGAPGRYTILRGDDLFISRRGRDGTASVSWLQATNALGGRRPEPLRRRRAWRRGRRCSRRPAGVSATI